MHRSAMFGLGISGFLCVGMSLLGYSTLVVMGIGGLLLTALLLIGLSKREQRTVWPHALVMVGYISMTTLIAIGLGGLTAGVAPWIVVTPMLTAAYSERRLVVPSLVLTCLVVVFIAWWSRTHPPPVSEDVTMRLVLQAFSICSAAVYLWVTSNHQETLRDQALNWMQATNFKLSEELEDHRITRAELEQTTEQLVTVARAAGMAEVATGVLHNLGNALNSVNVSMSLVHEELDDDFAAKLERAAGMAGTAEPELLARYLSTLASRHRDHLQVLRAETGAVRSRLEYVGTIVQAQQVHARSSGLVSDVALDQVIAQAVALTPQLSEEASIQLHVHVAPGTPTVSTERHKVLQILANLLANARDAVQSGRGGAGSIRIDARVVGEVVRIAVQDDGVGIDSTLQSRLFEHGFTTKKLGNGFGLHASALAARELGGSLLAQSDGPGTGATFELRLPFVAAHARRSAG